MHRRSPFELLIAGVLLLLFAAPCFQATLPAAELVAPEKLDAAIKPFIDGGWLQGVSIALVSEKGTQFVGYGRVNDQSTAEPNSETIFEIGSISKVFTATLLAQSVVKGQVALTDPLQSLIG